MLARYLQILAFLCALAVVVIAVVELDSRNDDEQAVPTALPSPTDVTPTLEPTEEPTDEVSPGATAERTGAAPAQAPTPSETQDQATTAPATATPTVAPPRTPTPEPAATAGPITQAEGRTPRTGADSLPAGAGLAIGALALRAIVIRRRAPY